MLKIFVYILILYNKDFVTFSEAAGGSPTPKSQGSSPTSQGQSRTKAKPKVENKKEDAAKVSKSVEQAFSNITMATVRSDGNPRYITGSDYELLDFHNDLFGLLFKHGIKCLGFKHGKQMVWQYDHNKNQGRHPTLILYKPDSHLYVDFAPNHNMFKYDPEAEEWKASTDETYTGSGLLSDTDHPKYLNIFTSDTLTGTVLKKNDTSKYKIYGHSNHTFLYVLNQDAICQEFKFKDNTVWKYNKSEPTKYPKSISVDMSKALAHFKIADKVESFKLSEEKIFQYPISSGEITYYTESEVKKLGLSVGEAQSAHTGPILVTLDLNSKISTSRCSYTEDRDLNTETYEAVTGYNFEKIVMGDNVLWEAEDKKFYTKVKLSVDLQGDVKITLSADGQDTITIDDKPPAAEEEDSTPSGVPESKDSTVPASKPSTPTTDGTDTSPSTPSGTPAATGSGGTTAKKKEEEDEIPELKGKNAVELDIKKSDSTEHFEFTKDEAEGLRIYTAKENVVFNKIIEDNEIFESKDKKDYLTKVILKGSKDKPKYMLLLPVVGDFLLYYKDKKGGEWRDITPLRISFSDFRFFGSEKAGSTVRELYHKHYDKSAHKFMFGYLFKKGVQCSQIRYKSNTMWTYSNSSKDAKNPSPYPLGLYYEMSNKNLYVLFPDNKRELLILPTTPTAKSTALVSVTTPTSVDVSTRTAVVLNLSKTDSTDHVEFIKNESTEDLKIYAAKDNVVFNKIIQSKTVGSDENVWQTGYKNEYAWRAVLKGSGDKPKHLMILPAIGNFILYNKQSKDTPWKDITSMRLNFSDFRFLGTDQNSTEVKQFDYTNYERKTKNFMFGYEFRDGVKCTKIMYKETELWTYTNSSKDANKPSPYPLGLYYELVDKALKLLLPDNQLELVSIPTAMTNVKGTHVASVVQILAETPAIDPLVMTLSFVTIYTYGSTVPNDRTKYDLNVSLDIATFQFKDDAMCTEVVYYGETVWKHDYSKHKDVYPKFVTVYLRNATIMISFKDDYLYVYKNFNKKWLTLFSDVPHPIQLSIKNQSCCEEYDYDKMVKVGTFTAKDNVVFKEVIKPKGSFSSDHYLHKSDDFSKYVYKVVIDGLGDKGKKIRLHQLNGRVLTVHKPYVWFGRSKGYSPYNIPDIRVVTRDSSMPNDTARYDIFKSGDNSNYVFKPEDMCTKLLVDDDIVWSHGPSKPYPKSVSYDRRSQMFALKYEDEDIIFRREGGGWQKEVVRTTTLAPLMEFVTIASVESKLPPIQVELEISKTESTAHSDYVKDEKGLRIYTAKPGYVFNKIVKKKKRWWLLWLSSSTKEVWKPQAPSEYAYNVVLKGSGNKPKYMLLLPVLGDFLLYYKQSKDTPWRDITSNRISFSDFRFFGPNKTGTGIRELVHRHYERTTYNFMFGYKFNYSVRCSQIKYKGITVWTHDPSKPYPFGLYYDLTYKYLHVQFPGPKWERQAIIITHIIAMTNSLASVQSSTVPESTPTADGSGSTPEDSTVADATKPSAPFELDIKKSDSTDHFELSKDEAEGLRIYTAKENVVFNKIIEDNEIFESKDKKDYLTKVILKGSGDKPKYMLVMSVVNSYMLYYKEKKDTPWRDITSLRLKFSDFRFLGTDKNGTEVKQFDYTNYERKTYNFMFVYRFKDGAKCTKIMYKDITLWVHSGDINDPYPLGLYYELYNKSLRLFFIESCPLTIKTHIGVDIDKAQSEYYYTTKDAAKNTCTFTAGKEYLFRIVRQGDSVIWETKDLTNNVEKVFYEGVDQDKKKITIFMGNGTSHVFEKSSSTEPWNKTKELSQSSDTRDIVNLTSEDQVPSSPEGSDSGDQPSVRSGSHTSSHINEFTSLFTVSKETRSKMDEEDQEDFVSGQKLSVYEIRIVTEGSAHANDHDKYEREVAGDAVTYKFKDGARCTHVGYEYQLVWKHDTAKHKDMYPHSVIVFVRTKVIFVLFKNGFVYSYKQFNNKWHTLLIGEPNPIQLDIKSKADTDQYSYYYDINTKFAAYVAKGSNVFKEVIRSKPSGRCGSDTVLLQAEKHRFSAYKVIIEGMGTKNKKVWLYLLNGNILHLCKKTDWKGIVGWDSCKPDVKIVTYGSYGPNDDTKFDLTEKDDVTNYVFKPGGRCTDILYDDLVVWQHDDNNTYPRSIIYGKDKKSFLLTFDDYNVIYKKHRGRWSKGLVELDIKKTESTDTFLYSKYEKEDLHVYTVKPGYLFNKVVINGCCFDSSWNSDCCNSNCCQSDCCESECCQSDSSGSVVDDDEVVQSGCCFSRCIPDSWKSDCYKQHSMWHSHSPDNFVYKVILKGSGDNLKYILLLPVDGNFLLYNKQSNDTPWRDITEERISFSDFTFFSLDKSGIRVREINYREYLRSTFNFMFGYRFKEGVKCTKIMYKRETIWVYTNSSKDAKNPSPYPLGLYYELVDKSLKLLLPGPEWIELNISATPTTSTPKSEEAKEADDSTPSTVPESTPATPTSPAKAEDKKPSSTPSGTPAAKEADDTKPSTVPESTPATPTSPAAKAEADTTPTVVPESTPITPSTAKEEEDTTPSVVPESTPTTPSTPAAKEEDKKPSSVPSVTPSAKEADSTPSTPSTPRVVIKIGTPTCPTIRPKPKEDKPKEPITEFHFPTSFPSRPEDGELVEGLPEELVKVPKVPAVPAVPSKPVVRPIVLDIVDTFLSRIKIVVLGDDGTQNSIGSDDYLLLVSKNILALFVFTDKVKTIELMFDDNSFWKRERAENEDLFPVSIVFKPDGYFYMDFNPFYYSYKFNNASGRLVHNVDGSVSKLFQFSNYSSHTWSGLVDPDYHPKYLGLYTLDSGTNRLKYNDTSQYKVYSYSDRMLLYVFKHDAKCYEFWFGNKVVWSYDKQKYQDNFPRSICVDITTALAHFKIADKVESFEMGYKPLVQYRLKSDVMLFSRLKREEYYEQLSVHLPESQFSTSFPTMPEEGASDDNNETVDVTTDKVGS